MNQHKVLPCGLRRPSTRSRAAAGACVNQHKASERLRVRSLHGLHAARRARISSYPASGSAATTSAGRRPRRHPRRRRRRARRGRHVLDTADVYGPRRERALLGEVLKGRREHVVVATKFGMDMGGANGPDWARAAHAGTCGSRSRRRWSGCRPRSTCTSTTCPTASRRSRRRSPRSTSWSTRGRSVTSGRRTSPGRRRRRGGGRGAGTRPRRRRAELVQPAGPRRRAPSWCRVRAISGRAPAVLPARQRSADGQVPPRRARAGGHADRRRGAGELGRAFDLLEALEAFAPSGATDARRGHRRPRRDARGRLGDRRRDEPIGRSTEYAGEWRLSRATWAARLPKAKELARARPRAA